MCVYFVRILIPECHTYLTSAPFAVYIYDECAHLRVDKRKRLRTLEAKVGKFMKSKYHWSSEISNSTKRQLKFNCHFFLCVTEKINVLKYIHHTHQFR